jgi:hypothetical protein
MADGPPADLEQPLPEKADNLARSNSLQSAKSTRLTFEVASDGLLRKRFR